MPTLYIPSLWLQRYRSSLIGPLPERIVILWNIEPVIFPRQLQVDVDGDRRVRLDDIRDVIYDDVDIDVNGVTWLKYLLLKALMSSVDGSVSDLGRGMVIPSSNPGFSNKGVFSRFHKYNDFFRRFSLSIRHTIIINVFKLYRLRRHLAQKEDTKFILLCGARIVKCVQQKRFLSETF